MNKYLKGLRCYNGYPIEFMGNSKDNIPYDKNDLHNFLKSKGVQVIDPKKVKFEGISEIQNRSQLFQSEDWDEIRRQMKIIVRKDLRCVDISDFTIFYMPKNVRTTGAIHEIIESDRQKKPTLILCPEGRKHIPTWLFGIIPWEWMFESLESLINTLDDIDKNGPSEKNERWQFILRNILSNDDYY